MHASFGGPQNPLFQENILRKNNLSETASSAGSLLVKNKERNREDLGRIEELGNERGRGRLGTSAKCERGSRAGVAEVGWGRGSI